LNFSGTRKGLVVDDILGYEEATVNNFGKFLEGLTQYTGYFISGRGIPRYVVDPLKIFEEDIVVTAQYQPIQEQYLHLGTVLVVDDSISVRKALQNILEAKN